MMTNMKRLLLLCTLLISFNSFADELSDALTSYVRGDYTTAITSYKKLAEKGHATAQFYLGAMYDKGQGTLQNTKEAIKWYTKAAEQGSARAQSGLGVMYNHGYGTPQDYRAAIKWYTKAAEQGVAKAQNNLGAMYVEGKGIPQDYVMVHMFWNIAAANGDENAKGNRDMVAGIMTPNQIEQAQKLAKEWMEKY